MREVSARRSRAHASLAIAFGLLCAAPAACSNEPSPVADGVPVAASSRAAPPTVASTAPAVQAGDGFGAPIAIETPFVPLADILKAPSAYDGKRVRTRGEVVAVCQAAGCWADLRPEGATKVEVPTHVTMHAHAFFLPRTARTRVAEVEGVLASKTLSQEECDHYNGEGASLVAGAPVLRVDALGVVLR